MRRILSKIPTTLLVSFAALALMLAGLNFGPTKPVSAACAALPTPNGSVTQNFTVSTEATYRIWSRIMVPDTSVNGGYYLEIDGTTCGVLVGGGGGTKANTWTWVSFKGGNTASRIDVKLAAGNHTIRMVGKEAGVRLDRVVMTADTNCTPTGYGDNCASPPQDTTAPTVNIVAPTNNQTVSGKVEVTATASDNQAVSKVEFIVDGKLAHTETAAPYGMSWDTTALANGNHTLAVKAYDAAGNTKTATHTLKVANGTASDTTPPTVAITAPTAGKTLTGTQTVTATASDNKAVSKVELLVDNVVAATDTATPFSFSLDTTKYTNGSHTLTAKAYDTSSNTKTASVTVTTSNTSTPPVGGKLQQIVSGIEGKCMDNASANLVENNKIQLWDCNKGNSQRWTLGSDGLLKVNNSNFCLKAAGTTSESLLQLGACANTATQKWKIEGGALKNQSTNLCVDVKNSVSTNGTQIWQYTCNGTNAQKWTFQDVVVYADEDVDQNGIVDLRDISLVLTKFDKTGTAAGRSDVNRSGKVEIGDVSLVLKKYND